VRVWAGTRTHTKEKRRHLRVRVGRNTDTHEKRREDVSEVRVRTETGTHTVSLRDSESFVDDDALCWKLGFIQT
jgi:hypothetical protein